MAKLPIAPMIRKYCKFCNPRLSKLNPLLLLFDEIVSLSGTIFKKSDPICFRKCTRITIQSPEIQKKKIN